MSYKSPLNCRVTPTCLLFRERGRVNLQETPVARAVFSGTITRCCEVSAGCKKSILLHRMMLSHLSPCSGIATGC